MAPGTVSLTCDLVRGDDSQRNSYHKWDNAGHKKTTVNKVVFISVKAQNVYIVFLLEVSVFINCLGRSLVVYMLNSGKFYDGFKVTTGVRFCQTSLNIFS